MSEAREQAAGDPPDRTNVRRLADAIRDVKNAMADRDDVVVEIREVTRTRLEMLAAELETVAADATAEHPGFDFAISSGQQPRFWIDAVAHVALGRDRRTYRFVRDTRNGRLLLAESADIKAVADAVTRYVAERVVERQRDLESGPSRASEAVAGSAAAEVPDAPEKSADEPAKAVLPAATVRPARAPEGPPRARMAELFATFALVAFGALVGAAAVLLYFRDRVPDLSGLF